MGGLGPGGAGGLGDGLGNPGTEQAGGIGGEPPGDIRQQRHREGQVGQGHGAGASRDAPAAWDQARRHGDAAFPTASGMGRPGIPVQGWAGVGHRARFARWP
ncbi:hypothetical protein SKB0092_07550 [Roseomonas mucosa]